MGRPPVERSVGCLLGGAVGDALGAPVEFLSMEEIRRRYGDAGITRYVEFWSGQGAFTDDTQMTLFTAEGLALAAETARGCVPKSLSALVESVHRAYLRWLLTQGEEANWGKARATPAALKAEGRLIREKGMWTRRSPGMTCLAALQSGRCGSTSDPINVSKGCGGIMRIAPVGLRCADPEEAFRAGCEVAAITHGHPGGYLPAGFLAALVSSLSRGEALPPSVERATALLRTWKGHEETMAAVEGAVSGSASRSRPGSSAALPFPEAIRALSGKDETAGSGGGWTGETALAIALFCALCHSDDFRAGVLAAVNHSGDSDSTGAIAGNILGANLGRAAIPREWAAGLEMADLVEAAAG